MAGSERKPVRTLHAIALHTFAGIEGIFHAYIEKAGTNGIEHHVLVTHDSCHPDLAPIISRHASSVSHANYLHGVKLPTWPRFIRAQRLRSIFSNIRPDVIVFYNSLGNAKLHQTALATTAARIYYERGAAWMTAEKSEAREFLSQVDLVVCNSRAARRMLELRCGLSADTGIVIHNPVRPELTGECVTPKSLDYNRPLQLGAAGRLVPIKGFPLAIHALRQLSDEGIPCELHIAGEGPFEEPLRALVSRLNLTNRVHFGGRLREMNAFYRKIDILLCPSLCEPLGNVCLEAGYMGCPVVCAAIDGMPEVVQDGRTGFCISPSLAVGDYAELGGNSAKLPEYVYNAISDNLMPPRPLDPAEIAAKARCLYEHPEVFTAMSAAAHEHVAASFQIQDYVRRINGLIQEAAALRRLA